MDNSDQRIIDLLEQALKRAKAGELLSILISVANMDGSSEMLTHAKPKSDWVSLLPKPEQVQ